MNESRFKKEIMLIKKNSTEAYSDTENLMHASSNSYLNIGQLFHYFLNCHSRHADTETPITLQ
jgi:hypothetical protein